MNEKKIDTLSGTMTAMAWHVGKHVAADPSGYNWRLMDEDVDEVIRVLQSPGTSCVILNDFNASRVKVLHNKDGSIVIRALSLDLISGIYDGDDTVLSDAGRLQFLEILRSVVHLPNSVKQEAREEYAKWLVQRDEWKKKNGYG